MTATPLSERLREASYPIGATVVALALWEAGVRLFRVPRFILPPPSSVATEGLRGWPLITPHFGITLYEAAVGLAAAILIAIPLGLIFSYSAFLRRGFYPLIVFVDEVPKIAFAPLLVTWFGFGLEPKVILTFIVCFFPIFLNSMAGFSSIGEEYINLGRSAGAREWEMFWKIRIQSAMPYVFVGLKMAASSAMTGAVVAEFLAADRGLGLFLQKSLSQLNMALGFATIVAMWVIGLSFFYGMTLIESWAIRWHVSRRGGRREIL
jgi:NitT/TauT family transport system permease protein